MLRWLLIAPIRVYKFCISPLLPRACRFYPSCSTYAIQAITVHGPLKGLGLAIWRVLRCNPWSPGGFDPVPPKRPSHQSNAPHFRKECQERHG